MDASKHGLGATIVQEGRPVAYVSKLFNSTERMTDERDKRETTRRQNTTAVTSLENRWKVRMHFPAIFSEHTVSAAPAALERHGVLPVYFQPCFFMSIRSNKWGNEGTSVSALFNHFKLSFHLSTKAPETHMHLPIKHIQNCTPLPFLEKKIFLNVLFSHNHFPCTHQILSYSGLQSTLKEMKKKVHFMINHCNREKTLDCSFWNTWENANEKTDIWLQTQPPPLSTSAETLTASTTEKMVNLIIKNTFDQINHLFSELAVFPPCYCTNEN